MPGSRAQRPGDIVTAMSGKTIEVINTDAEGRLILADAMAYARKQGCTHLVDVATLTGAVVVALGHLNVDFFPTTTPCATAYCARRNPPANACGRCARRRLQGLPEERLRGPGECGRTVGGAITAAIFLKEFAEETPWVHLDIAGTAWLDESKPYLAKGPRACPFGRWSIWRWTGRTSGGRGRR